MKKLIPIIFMFFLVYSLNDQSEIIIPDYAIRFRVIANSNTVEDQALKLEVRDAVEEKLNNLMSNASTVMEAKNIINQNLASVESLVKSYDSTATISFGLNYFPAKNYKGVNYPSGNYESLVITLGNGEGNNWWCVMFPPLCLIDQDIDTSDTEYRFYIKDILDKYVS